MDEQVYFYQRIGQAIRNHRHAEDKTLEEIAGDIGMDDKHLGRIERGEKHPKAITLYKLSRRLQFSVDALFDEIQKELDLKKRE